MSEYLKKIGIKSVLSLNKWFKTELFKQGKWVDMECVKVANYVYVFWAKDDKLHRYAMQCSVIYVLQENDIKQALNEIIKTL